MSSGEGVVAPAKYASTRSNKPSVAASSATRHEPVGHPPLLEASGVGHRGASTKYRPGRFDVRPSAEERVEHGDVVADRRPVQRRFLMGFLEPDPPARAPPGSQTTVQGVIARQVSRALIRALRLISRRSAAETPRRAQMTR